MKKAVILLSMFLAIGTSVYATEGPAISLGKTLFETTELGTKNRSCSSCHPNGKGLEKTGDFNDNELSDIINACLRDALGAEMLSPASQEMEALLTYVRSLQKNPE